MEIGYIRLFRKLLDSRVWQNEGLLKVWLWCLLKASHKDRYTSIKSGTGETEVKIKRGQFIFGRLQAAKELRMKPSTVRDRIKKLVKYRNLDTNPTTHYTIITVLNWEDYQYLEDDARQLKRQQPDSNPTATRQQPDTDNNVLNDSNDQSSEQNPCLTAIEKHLIQMGVDHSSKTLGELLAVPEISIRRIDRVMRNAKAMPKIKAPLKFAISKLLRGEWKIEPPGSPKQLYDMVADGVIQRVKLSKDTRWREIGTSTLNPRWTVNVFQRDGLTLTADNISGYEYD